MLPISSKDGTFTPFLDCLFTATSSSCVTGLVVQDTATHWSLFGQIVILIMIQIGGMGIITMSILFALLSGKKVNIMQRSTMQESISAHKLGGILNLSRFIIITSAIIELLGAVAFSFVFCKEYGFIKGVWMSLFHSISAFCNAGFDLMGESAKFSSLTSYVYNPLINITVMLLILIGGIGFLTWDDIKEHKFHIRRYRMQTKVIFLVTAILVIVPALYFFFFEFENLTFGKRVLVSVFQAVTPRTAGFNTVDALELSETGNAVVSILMLIGGAPGSTAGGMKITTIAVLFAAAISVFRKRDSAQLMHRRIGDDNVKNAATIL
ncbi:MAG: Trk family potassium uptake protein, partial [Clostridia bacterium]|nr:Trk family potassium uptake protein [Clostridia bacterium]